MFDVPPPLHTHTPWCKVEGRLAPFVLEIYLFEVGGGGLGEGWGRSIPYSVKTSSLRYSNAIYGQEQQSVIVPIYLLYLIKM